MQKQHYDIIGDIHGHADELIQLLELMGYSLVNGYHQHPTRKVIFLGDFV
ncbi:MAG: diadenosine tetraphosphatase, partial [Methylococcales bacterium]|nr:diadenosine tetraphosphatase [Methylococcales bacterium]